MYFGGTAAIIIVALVAVGLLIRSNINYRKKVREEKADTLFYSMLASEDKNEIWSLLCRHITQAQIVFMKYVAQAYMQVTDGFMTENLRILRKSEQSLMNEKAILKNTRRKETLCFRHINKDLAIEKNAWFHLGNNCSVSMLYNLRRISEFCKEHVDNNFMPLPTRYVEDFTPVRDSILQLLERGCVIWENGYYEETVDLRNRCEEVKKLISQKCKVIFTHLQEDDTENLTVTYVYLNMLQESQELLSAYRQLLRAGRKLQRS